MKKVILGIINDLDANHVDSGYIERLKNLTDFWIFNATSNLKMFDIDVSEFNSEDQLLSYAETNNYDYCIGNWIGHLLRPAQLDSRQVIIDTINLCKEKNGLVGHIISYKDKIPYFYKEFWCVDINIYKSLGTPAWETTENEFPNFLKSEENFHDDYTPYYITPADGTSLLNFQISWGTGLIKTWLQHQKTIYNFPIEIRELKHHLYPEHYDNLNKYFNKEITVNDLENPLQKRYFTDIDYENAKKCIFLFNTDTLTFQTPKVKIDTLISVCAAFRPYLILYRSGFDADTTVKFIDYSQISLDFKKWLVNNWDGIDIFDAVKNFEREGNCPKSKNIPFHESELTLYNTVIEQFGSEEIWLNFWRQYKQLKHEYHLIDLVNEVDKIEMLIEHNQNYIYFSNSFNTEAGLVNWGKTKLLQSFNQLLTLARQVNAIVDGSDVDHHYPDPNFVDIVKKDYII